MFSVIIPAFNAERFISIAINSVLAQTYKDFEIIIVDDGSKDGTRGVIEKYKDDRIKYIYQENAGVSVARNKGILESNGEYICFLDSDDEWKENHLVVLNSLIKKYNHCGLFITGYDIRLNDGRIINKSELLLRHIPEEQFTSDNGFDILIKNGYFFNTNTICCKKDVFDKVGLFEIGIKNGEDDDMWFRIFVHYSIAVSKQVTTVYNRFYCGATGKRSVFKHKFLDRVEYILKSPEIPQYRKNSVQTWVARHNLSQVRKYILFGDKSEALKLLKDIQLKKVSKKKYIETLFCFAIPSGLIKKYIDKRDSEYYK